MGFSVLALFAVAWFSLTLHPPADNLEFVRYQIRLPRFVLASLLGAGLGLAGMLLQLATRNPLSEPELLGINQCAVLAVVILTLLTSSDLHPGWMVCAALLGGAGAGVTVLGVSTSGVFPRDRLILLGLTIAFFCGSASSGLLLLRDADLFELLHWMAGKLSGSSWTDVTIAGVALLGAVGLAVLRCSAWNLLSLGDDSARTLGVDPVARRLEMVAITTVLCAVAVALAGPIGFVGIMVPHLTELLVGLDYRRRLPIALLAGALLVSLSDLLGRSLLYPAELPVGVLTAFLGAPYFLYRARES